MDVAGLRQSFQIGLTLDGLGQCKSRGNSLTLEDDDAEMLDSSESGDPNEDDFVEVSGTLSAKALEAQVWVDAFILGTWRKSRRQTEESMLHLWKRWLPSMLMLGEIPDIIIDANHTIQYLNKEDFDVTENTILDSQLFPEHFEQVKMVIFTEHLNVSVRDIYWCLSARLIVFSLSGTALKSIIKAHFGWTWQCMTLNHGDELVTLLLSCIQPHQLFIPDYTTADGHWSGFGRYIFSVLSLYHETKVAKPGQSKPDYNCVLPNKDLLRCPIGTLALLFYYVFDQKDLITQIPDWDWSSSVTW
ncbi:hypothetical protein A0H81_05817 [Grifola frondosa]|uniref:Uncharacterized protein n=1 Tax=Grifola frondosa TaxID=5627 RepID=A0A1C7MA08_GRIFR|nr:hypothetical protein A0H81_05817 [Grifola frondosa]